MTTDTEFDPYHKWLGIPKSEQPPNHYRLLGIALFESDVEVIDAAANQRMSYLQEVAVGPHMDLSQKLLNEISAARRCLLDPKKKAEYDARLREELGRRESASGAVQRLDTGEATAAPLAAEPVRQVVRPRRRPRKSAGKESAQAGTEEAVAETESVEDAERRRRKMMITAGVSAVSVLIAIAIYVFSRGGAGATAGSGQAVLVVDWPMEQRKNGRVEIDGRSVELPESNPVEIPLSPGRHKIVFERLGYNDIKFQDKFLPGERVPVRLNWRPLPAEDTSDIQWTLPGESEKSPKEAPKAGKSSKKASRVPEGGKAKASRNGAGKKGGGRSRQKGSAKKPAAGAASAKSGAAKRDARSRTGGKKSAAPLKTTAN